MEDKIEVGEYVRTKDGIIDKVIIEYDGKCNNPNCSEKHISCKYNYYNEKDIVKHSKQLKDLIEVKDVIKYRINNISTTLETKGYVEGIVDISDEEMLKKIKSDKNYHILEILTKEIYIANCYKVGEEDETN